MGKILYIKNILVGIIYSGNVKKQLLFASFRYCRNGPITEPGYYKFYYLDIDIMEITHWE